MFRVSRGGATRRRTSRRGASRVILIGIICVFVFDDLWCV